MIQHFVSDLLRLAAMPGQTLMCVAIAVLCALSLSLPGRAECETYDVVLANGRVMDPQSGRDEIAHVGIRDGRIAAISTTPLPSRKRLNVEGLIVAPGFIDLHSHAQHVIGQKFQVMDGVTTAIDGELGALPLRTYYATLEGKALINFGATASHACARLKVLDSVSCEGHVLTNPQIERWSPSAAPRARTVGASDEQTRLIVQALREALREGALGFGLSIEYTPGAGRAEIYEVFKAAGELKVPVFAHVRRRQLDTAPGIAIAVAQEVIADAVLTGAPLQIVHVHSTGLRDTPVVIDMVASAQARGFDITTEAYPYAAASTSIGSELFTDGWQARFGIDYGDLQWAATGERLTEATFNKYRAESPQQNVILHMIPGEIVDMTIAHPLVSIASDGMPWITSGEHPRGAGTFARVLGNFVRERHQLDLMTALAKMTIMPAKRLEGVAPEMAHKGRLQEGADADITVFDAKMITDKATFEKPMQYSQGIRHVFVGGTLVVRDGSIVEGTFPGRAVKGRHAVASPNE